ncbi:hypothetical protein [Curvibacter gracilis]|uniref:hypothetical protein n=1 Tax=Curvibacter gracilis TaxID=230310 RepID=UPI000A03617E|nr:hypothetical protein [Curvibacter gracilis]
MLEVIEGNVKSYKAIKRNHVQFELRNVNRIIELSISEPWVINRGDDVAVVGELDDETGKFIGYAYRNRTKNVFGRANGSIVIGYLFVIASLLFFWAIFPLFLHLRIGLALISTSKKFDEAAGMI